MGRKVNGHYVHRKNKESNAALRVSNPDIVYYCSKCGYEVDEHRAYDAFENRECE